MAQHPICPICKKAKAKHEYRPFCSKICADIDLQHWLGGSYAIASSQPPDEADLDDIEESTKLH